jgi:hypothetical protein
MRDHLLHALKPSLLAGIAELSQGKPEFPQDFEPGIFGR